MVVVGLVRALRKLCLLVRWAMEEARSSMPEQQCIEEALEQGMMLRATTNSIKDLHPNTTESTTTEPRRDLLPCNQRKEE
jgi:hypothetical protein